MNLRCIYEDPSYRIYQQELAVNTYSYVIRYPWNGWSQLPGVALNAWPAKKAVLLSPDRDPTKIIGLLRGNMA